MLTKGNVSIRHLTDYHTVIGHKYFVVKLKSLVSLSYIFSIIKGPTIFDLNGGFLVKNCMAVLKVSAIYVH